MKYRVLISAALATFGFVTRSWAPLATLLAAGAAGATWANLARQVAALPRGCRIAEPRRTGNGRALSRAHGARCAWHGGTARSPADYRESRKRQALGPARFN